MLGTNGGGFFNANSSHPFENPTPLSNLMQMFSIFVIPAALTVTLGRMTRTPKHGWAVFAAMATLFFVGVLVVGRCFPFADIEAPDHELSVASGTVEQDG